MLYPLICYTNAALLDNNVYDLVKYLATERERGKVKKKIEKK